ncbi:unnamed protein product, partial [Amoebophrya sp. A120]|eukprot:GSA120T00015480001.1
MKFEKLPAGMQEVYLDPDQASQYYITTAATYEDMTSDTSIICPYYNSEGLGCNALRSGVLSVVGVD